MASKQDKFYYQNLIDAAEISVKAAEYLVECLEGYDPEKFHERLDKMHAFEHHGDEKKHEMSHALAKAFVTPVDREDLAQISQNIDEVTDSVEEVLQRFYMDQIKEVTPEAVEFSKKIVECCRQMKDMLGEFENFKKPAKLHQMVVDLNHTEEECDRLYMEACLNLRRISREPLDIFFWREIYDEMEDCSDACEHVGDCIETVVMKNS